MYIIQNRARPQGRGEGAWQQAPGIDNIGDVDSAKGERDEEERESVQTRPVEPDSENPQTRTFSEATVCGSRKARPKGHHTLSLKVKKERRSRW